MIKYAFIIIGVYILYYAGNMAYDLFIKKDKVIETDSSEEFSIGDFAESEKVVPKQVQIEDVENISTPKSYLKHEINSQVDEELSDINDLREKFEAEQELNDFMIPSNQNALQPEIFETNTRTIISETKKKVDWKALLQLSETSVQMVANYEGQKVYHSIM